MACGPVTGPARRGIVWPGRRRCRSPPANVKSAGPGRSVRCRTRLRRSAEGALSPEHVDVLAGANSDRRSVLFASHEETLVEQAKLLRFGDCCQMVEYWKQRADAAGCEDEAERRHEARHATAATTFDEMVDLRALLDPLGGSDRGRRVEPADGTATAPRQARRDGAHRRPAPCRRPGRDGDPFPHARPAGCDRAR